WRFLSICSPFDAVDDLRCAERRQLALPAHAETLEGEVPARPGQRDDRRGIRLRRGPQEAARGFEDFSRHRHGAAPETQYCFAGELDGVAPAPRAREEGGDGEAC